MGMKIKTNLVKGTYLKDVLGGDIFVIDGQDELYVKLADTYQGVAIRNGKVKLFNCWTKVKIVKEMDLTF